MQQTVDAVVNVTKDQEADVVLDSDSVTTLVSGSSYFFSAAAVAAMMVAFSKYHLDTMI